MPSEAEWEKAARGADGRIYPWGQVFDPDRANSAETGIGTTSAVGAMPAGQSPYKLFDMSGNVWEWTRSLWGPDITTAEFTYPYSPADGREDLWASDRVYRLLRGGAFYEHAEVAGCAVRLRFKPDGRHFSLGFRVAASPFDRL